MTKQEFAMLAMAIKTYYPKESILPNDKAMELWYMQLQDLPYKVAEIALNKWVSLNKWSPAISDLRQLAAEISNPEIKDWSAAWDEVQAAIHTYGFYEANKGLDSLSPLTREVTKRIGFTNLCLSENQSVDRANFRTIYETLAEREKKNEQISPQVRELIENIHLDLLEERKYE